MNLFDKSQSKGSESILQQVYGTKKINHFNVSLENKFMIL